MPVIQVLSQFKILGEDIGTPVRYFVVCKYTIQKPTLFTIRTTPVITTQVKYNIYLRPTVLTQQAIYKILKLAVGGKNVRHISAEYEIFDPERKPKYWYDFHPGRPQTEDLKNVVWNERQRPHDSSGQREFNRINIVKVTNADIVRKVKERKSEEI
jgi:hypothetical protein